MLYIARDAVVGRRRECGVHRPPIQWYFELTLIPNSANCTSFCNLLNYVSWPVICNTLNVKSNCIKFHCAFFLNRTLISDSIVRILQEYIIIQRDPFYFFLWLLKFTATMGRQI